MSSSLKIYIASYDGYLSFEDYDEMHMYGVRPVLDIPVFEI